MDNTFTFYTPAKASASRHIPIRGDVSYHIRHWAAKEDATLGAPPLLLLHGWMDVGASFQRCVDHLNSDRDIFAIDWRGFGGSKTSQPSDRYWFYDYYADLDAIIDHLSPRAPVDLLGHSMGGNIAMIYAGTCPERVRRLVNVEGFGLPRTAASEAPARLARWLSELKTPVAIRSFASLQDVVNLLIKRSPHMEVRFATWLAQQWAQPKEDGRWHICADAVHKRVNPILYQSDEVLASWQSITANVLWVEGDRADHDQLSGGRYSREEFESRLGKVKSLERIAFGNCEHMVHLDQPQHLADAVERFLSDR